MTSRLGHVGDAVVTAESQTAAAAGAEILRQGGNAVDAAAAVAFVACVVQPAATTIAGSGFMLIHDGASHPGWSVEFPPRAPLGASADMYRLVAPDQTDRLLGLATVAGDANQEGWLSAGVPAIVAGLSLAHERFGRLPFERVIEPAIQAAHDGFEVDEEYALMALAARGGLCRDSEAARTFLDSSGVPPVPPFDHCHVGQTAARIRQPELGRTLEALAASSRETFYHGPIAQALAAEARRNGGLITEEDLAAYEASVTRPLRARYREWELLCPCSPCGGWTELQILRVLAHLPMQDLGHNTPESLHALIEASRRAFADRYFFQGDPDFVSVPLQELLSFEYTRELAEAIRPGQVGLSFDAGTEEPWIAFGAYPEHDPRRHAANQSDEKPVSARVSETLSDPRETTHMSIIDHRGMCVSCTITAAGTFGSKVMVRDTGILLDNAMVWFNPQAGTANSIAAWKRPLVNMGPLIVTRAGRPLLALGAPGGRRVISAVVQVVSNVLDHGMSLADALGAPRVDASGRDVLAGTRISASTRSTLAEIGHPIVPIDEEYHPFSYEFARPNAVMLPAGGRAVGAAHPFAKGATAYA